MNAVPGPLIASGRAADVYEAGEGRVLRRYKADVNSAPEAELMSYLFARGLPVPQVFDANGRDIVMERLDGPTMIEAATRAPWRLPAYARVLAQLQSQLNAVSPPEFLPCRFGEPLGVLHFDLHPLNVMMTSHGPVLIDFSAAMAGDPAADVAQTWILIGTSEIPGSKVERTLGSLGRRTLLTSYLRVAGRERAREFLGQVSEYRLLDVHVTDPERVSIRALAERHGRGQT